MSDVKIKPYDKKLTYSYSYGVFPTLELMEARPKEAIKVLLHSRGRDNEGVRKIVSLANKLGIKCETADGLINKLSLSGNTYAVGIFRKYSTHLESDTNHVVLVNPEDAGNLGTIMRTALGFGVNNLAIIKPAVDIFDPKTIRASMGAVFKMRIEYLDNFESYQKEYKNNIYCFMTSAKEELSAIEFVKPFSLVFGSESAGLPDEYFKYGKAVYIRQNNSIDSLNLSMAVGLALYKSFV